MMTGATQTPTITAAEGAWRIGMDLERAGKSHRGPGGRVVERPQSVATAPMQQPKELRATAAAPSWMNAGQLPLHLTGKQH